MEQIVVIEGEVNLSSSIDGEVALTSVIDGEIDKAFLVDAAHPHYMDVTEVTPSNLAQVLLTSGMVLDSDITINPIPSNYGLITWNGSVLTVS